MPVRDRLVGSLRQLPGWRLWAIVAGAALIALLLWRGGGNRARDIPTFEARRGPLNITVVEGGSLQALEFQEFKCEVRVGYQGTKILKIVEEGYLVTEEDVKNGKVLCELDSSDLQKRLVEQEIQYQSTLANLTDAEQNYEIQLSQNESDVKAAEQKARFARMDFDKFLGDIVTEEIIHEIQLTDLLETEDLPRPDEVATVEIPVNAESSEPLSETSLDAVAEDALLTAVVSVGEPTGTFPSRPDIPQPPPPAPEPSQEPSPTETEPSEMALPSVPTPTIDFLRYAKLELLGDGEAKQKLRKLEDDLRVAQKELGQARMTLEGTQRLFERGFVPQTEVTRDEIAYESARLKVQTAETAQALFLKYEFVKSAEEAMSKYTEAVRELDKARRVAISKLAQAKAKLNSAKGQFEVQSRQRGDLQDQLDKCTMRAEQPGLVVYGSGRETMIYYGDQEPIREGATVRERQAILTIPDLTRMSVDVRIHESYIKKVKKGLKARITVDAFPDEILTGEVMKVAVLPDSENRWMNPDLKVYLTTIMVDGTQEWVKPGMSAKVEILVNHLEDVVYVPVQAVIPHEGKHVCFVARGFKPEQREVTVGEFNDEFIEIKEGVVAGEHILLSPPDGFETAPAGVIPGSEDTADAAFMDEQA